jgi:hypothetical protein
VVMWPDIVEGSSGMVSPPCVIRIDIVSSVYMM